MTSHNKTEDDNFPYEMISTLGNSLPVEQQPVVSKFPSSSQGALLAAGLMGAVSAGLVPVVKVKKAA